MQTENFLQKEISLGNQSSEDVLPFNSGTDTVSKLGKRLVEGYTEIAKNEAWLSKAHKSRVEEFFDSALGMEMPSAEEFKNMTQEDLAMPSNTSLYTTVLRGMVEKAFRPQLVMADTIRTISVNPQGMKELQVPINALRTASDLPDDGVLPDPSNDPYTDQKIQLKWIYSYEVVTHQLIKQGIIDVIADQMFELGDALSRKVDSDIITSVENASPSDNSNSNFKQLSGNLGYSELVDAVMNHASNYAVTDTIVTNPLTWANFLKDSNVISALGYNSQDKGSVFPKIQDFLGLKLVLTPQASTGNVYLLDSPRTKYLVEGSGIEMLDARKSGTVNWEIIGLKLYGVNIVQPTAVYRIVESGGALS